MKISNLIVNYLDFLSRIRVVWIGGLMIVLGLGVSGTLGQNSASSKNESTVEAEAAGESDEEAFPISVFSNQIGQGKDPFFPESTRRQLKSTPKTSKSGSDKKANEPDLSKPDLSLFKVKGIIGGSIALINGRTFEKGESAAVKTSAGEIDIECVQVTRDSVEVRIRGYAGTHMLYLGGVK